MFEQLSHFIDILKIVKYIVKIEISPIWKS